MSKAHHLPVNAAFLIAFLSIAINAAVIGSTVACKCLRPAIPRERCTDPRTPSLVSAITAAATIGTNLSYLIPIVARQTLGRKTFQPAKWNLGIWSLPISIVSVLYIMFLFVVLMLPQLYPVNAVSLPEACGSDDQS